MNLCLNARDAMPDGGNLEISTQQVEMVQGVQHIQSIPHPGSYSLVRIRDSGIGMDAQVQARLFEPFFTTKEVGQGTGLGLAVVYGIIKQHHAEILVESQLGQGTTFLLYFPSTELEAEVAEECGLLATSSQAEVVPHGPKTILLVEDDPDVQLIMSEVLCEQGYTVLVASDGVEGLQLFEQHTSVIALVIADIMMPRMQGRQFQEQIFKLRADTKMLVISGHQQTDLERGHHLLDSSMSAFLQKPFDLDVFTAKVYELIYTK